MGLEGMSLQYPSARSHWISRFLILAGQQLWRDIENVSDDEKVEQARWKEHSEDKVFQNQIEHTNKHPSKITLDDYSKELI